MGKTSTLVVSQPDIARYARTRNTPVWSQALALPIGNTACAALGIFATSAIENSWGASSSLWNPRDLCDEILTRNWTPGIRTWVFIVNAGFVLSQVAGNLGYVSSKSLLIASIKLIFPITQMSSLGAQTACPSSPSFSISSEACILPIF
jgi:cytosine/uracil/thiamine/allantoin permease